MNPFVELLRGVTEFEDLCEGLSHGATPIATVGVTGSEKNHLIYAAAMRAGKKCLVVAPDEQEARRIRDDLCYFFRADVPLFPTKEYVFYDVDVSTRQSESKRLRTLCRLAQVPAAVTSIQALMQYTLPKERFDRYSRTISVGETVAMELLLADLAEMGYKRVTTVEGMGQFSVRGSICDVFSPASPQPVRIEFFDDEVDSVRSFDPLTQLSVEKTDTAVICPVRELLITAQEAEDVAAELKKQKNENLGADIEKLQTGRYFASLDKYMPFFYQTLPSLTDYLDDDWMVFFDEPKLAFEKSKTFGEDMGEMISSLLTKGVFPKTKRGYLNDYTALAAAFCDHPLVTLSGLTYQAPEISPKRTVSITAKTLHSYRGQITLLYEDLEYWKGAGYRVMVLLSSEARMEHLASDLADLGIDAAMSEDTIPEPGQILLAKGGVARGFEYPAAKIAVVSDGEMFAKHKRKKKRAAGRDAIRSFEELSVGDYVVHDTHGIGQYVGIEQLVVDKVTRDYIKIRYQSGDNLYVPTGSLDLIHKYVGAEAGHVRLSKMGGADWQRTTGKVKQSVEALAEDLIALYAERSRIRGHVFPPDTPWQKEFEDTFPYEETPDQIKCIAEVKEDMEQGKSMDRLLCGDVGYGKTEVAMRAAFKCVMEGMQVAYLVPTTILAQQHYNNFSSRMKDFPVRVEMLSRFRTKKEQSAIIEKLKKGEVDIVIGTHRLLQKDVAFKNLGFVIIDEEQRFGVTHKERLKELKKDVDVLTLSATPIPRTLHMAMVGIRDLSVITSPPQDRFPVQTFVLEHNEAVIENAVDRELSRGGQVYYLFNRVEGIERKAMQLAEQFPDAVVQTAHGKMSETQLEEIMIRLMQGEIDILVCTTIIETGLDVANVNTIIIENADRMGLSQLYQLRGRVGRSNRLAYAYLTYRRDKVLDQTAFKRLQAVKEFTEFGSGFKIALRDLEIRGAGNLLGRQQHGNMNLVGYDMYCMLLDRAVKELKGEPIAERLETAVELQVDAYIPHDYVTEEELRIELYRKIAAIQTQEDLEDTEDEILDRYGDLPQSVYNLTAVAYIKAMAQQLGITEIVQRGGMVTFTFSRQVAPKAIVELLGQYDRKLLFSAGETSYLSYKYDADMVGNIKIILQKLINTEN